MLQNDEGGKQMQVIVDAAHRDHAPVAVDFEYLHDFSAVQNNLQWDSDALYKATARGEGAADFIVALNQEAAKKQDVLEHALKGSTAGRSWQQTTSHLLRLMMIFAV